MADTQFRNNTGQNRYEAVVEGEVAGFAEYEIAGEQITFTHTIVEERFGGQGIGGKLVEYALNDVRDTGSLTVIPQCSFVHGWIDKHPEYVDLLDDAYHA